MGESFRGFHSFATIHETFFCATQFSPNPQITFRCESLLYLLKFPAIRALTLCILIVQVVPTLVLAVYTTLYVYIQPYKSRLANVIESAVNMNFLLLLILNSTAFFHDDYLTFPAQAESYNSTTDSCSGSVRGVATVSWVLMPFYYLPLGLFCVILCSLSSLWIWYAIQQ